MVSSVATAAGGDSLTSGNGDYPKSTQGATNMTTYDDATTAARLLTPEQATAQAITHKRLANTLRDRLARGQGDDTTRTSLALSEASARACHLRAVEV
jgi:hypothetical protein